MTGISYLGVSSLVSYFIAVLLPAFDALIPVLPSETAVAAVIWASYAFFIGRLGGRAFEHRPWAGLLLALGLTIVISALIEVARRAWARCRGLSPAAGPVTLGLTEREDSP